MSGEGGGVFPHSGMCARCGRDRDDLFWHRFDRAFYCADIFRCEARHEILGEHASTRVMVTGSRTCHDVVMIEARLDRLPANSRLMQGGAKGVDLVAADWAKARGRVCERFAPDYTRPSPQRYHERNDRMLDLADLVLAFWDGTSRGTASVIAKARRRGIPLEVHRASQRPLLSALPKAVVRAGDVTQ